MKYNLIKISRCRYEEGFTLIEILVNINISFILISLLISVYLFTSRLTTTSIKEIENKTETIMFVSTLYTCLEKANAYSIIINDNSSILIIDENNIIAFSENKISNSELADLENFDSYELTLTKNDGSKISIVNGVPDTGISLSKDIELNCNELRNIGLMIEHKGKKYTMQFCIPPFLKNNFKNITE